MVLYHTTPVKNLEMIRARGLLPELSQGKQQIIWLHSPGMRVWAVRHLLEVGRETPLTTMRGEVLRSMLTRRRRGIWMCQYRIPPECLRTVAIETWLQTLGDEVCSVEGF